MGYISINPKLCLCSWLLETLMLEYDFDPKLCLCAWLLGRAQFKLWGVKKNSVLSCESLELSLELSRPVSISEI